LRVFVETNFVLEVALEQQDSQSCERILELASSGAIRLVLPAYSLVEPYETLTRRHRDRESLRKQIVGELKQLARSAPLAQRVATSQDVVKLLAESAEHETRQIEMVRARVLSLAEVLPLTNVVINRAADCQTKYDLSPQDAVVYASIRASLDADHTAESIFISRNPADFRNPDLRQDLASVQCKYFSSFAIAAQFIEHVVEGT
jgi:predicted nucleic acid-binding protein